MSVVMAAPSGMGVMAEKVARVVNYLEEEKKKIENTLTGHRRMSCDDAKHLRDIYRAIDEKILPSLVEIQLELEEEQTELAAD